jgi:phosphatidylethanolamine-binding protein (PEBP) family uncharacterized protein
MGDYALLTLWMLTIGMAVKGKRRTRSCRGRVCGLRRRCRSKTVQRGAGDDAAFSVRWADTGVAATHTGAPAKQAATVSQPTVEWMPAAATDSLYTLIVWDPDAVRERRIHDADPDAPSAASSYLHWLVLNCKGSTPATGEVVMPWAPPPPPPGTGTHRYMFGLYTQAGPLSVRVDKRPQFNPDQFAELHGLTHHYTKWITISSSRLP